jgi:hypothetical protein
MLRNLPALTRTPRTTTPTDYRCPLRAESINDCSSADRLVLLDLFMARDELADSVEDLADWAESAETFE